MLWMGLLGEGPPLRGRERFCAASASTSTYPLATPPLLLPPVYYFPAPTDVVKTTPRPAAPPPEQLPSPPPGHTSSAGRLPWATPARPRLPLFVLIRAGARESPVAKRPPRATQKHEYENDSLK